MAFGWRFGKNSIRGNKVSVALAVNCDVQKSYSGCNFKTPFERNSAISKTVGLEYRWNIGNIGIGDVH